jgi:hypothetical protein
MAERSGLVMVRPRGRELPILDNSLLERRADQRYRNGANEHRLVAADWHVA